jgi:hypothetical protein
MEPIAIENRPNFYERPTLIVREPRDSIAAKDYSIVDEGSGPNGGGSSGTNGGIYLQYKFEENGNEEKNGSYNLTPNGSPNFSNYVELDGDDYLSVGINFEVKTLSFWFNLNNANTDNYLLSFDSDFYIKVNSNSLDVQTDNENNCNISKDFFNGIWYNLALTSNNENYDIYLNNTKLPETIIYKDLSSSTLNIGAYITDELQIEKYTTSITIESHSMVVINNNMYVFGGTTSNKFYKINTDGTIEEKTLNGNTDNIPSARSKHSMVAIGSNIYIFGGKNDGIDFDDFYKIDTTTYNSTKIELQPTDGNSDNKPSARSGHSMVAINSNIYIYGGYDNFQGIFFDDFYKIDTTSSNCTKIELQPTDGTKPTERSGHSMVAIESNIYIFGGHYANFFDDLYKIDTTTNISTEIELQPIDGNSDNRPSKRTGHSMVAIGTNIYIFGGMYADGNSELYNDLYKIDINGNSKKISFNAESITERYFHTMVVLDNNFYIYGGKNIDGNTVILNDLVKIPTDIKYLNGKIADLRLYNTIKTEYEINTIYNQYNYVNIYTHIPEEDIEYDFSSIATYNAWIAKANSHNIETFNFIGGIDNNNYVLSTNNNDPNKFRYIQCSITYYKNFNGLLLALPITHNYVEFTITSRNPNFSFINYTVFIDTIVKLDQDIFISDADKNYKFEDNTEKFDEEYYYFAQFTSSTSITKKYSYKPGHYLKIAHHSTSFDPNIKITLKKNYTEYTNLIFNENALFDILVVGGGGGGGYNAGGGGGAGGLVYGSNIILDHTNVHNIKVGKGGIGGIGDIGGIGEVSSTNGSDTTFGNIIAMGGGGGVDNYGIGNIGGSGGGSSTNTAIANSIGGSKAQIDKFIIGDKILVGYGNDGGIGRTEEEGGVKRSAGGGGGAGSSGKTSGNYETDDEQLARIENGGDGGVGRQYDITGINQYYAGGGGGGIHNNYLPGNPGDGGLGGGGNGGQPNSSGTDGVDGTGSGGGGCGGFSGNGGNGGSGIVILKKIRTDPPTSDGILTLNIVNDFDSGYILDSSISSNYANITKIILNVNANIYRNDKPENYGQAGLIIDLNSLTKLTELELNINPSKGIYGGPGSPGISGNHGGGLGGDPIKIIGNGSISIRYTEGAKLFKGGNGGNYTDWNDEVTIELKYKLNIYQPKPNINIPNTDGLIGEFFNGNKKVKYNYNIIFKEQHRIINSLDIEVDNGNDYEVIDTNTGRNIFNNDNVYLCRYNNDKTTIDIHFVNKPAEGTDMTPFVMDTLSTTPIVFNNNHPIIYDFSHITSLPDWNTYATDYGFNSTFDAGFQEASDTYYAGVWTHHPATGFISKEIPAGYTNLRVEYQALWDNTVSIYITPDSITNYITLDPTLDTNDITETARDTVTVAEGLKIFEATINPETDKYLTVAERYSTLSNNLKIVFY